MPEQVTTVVLGDRRFPVVPQKHARLRKYLTSADMQKIMSRDYATESYRILCILIPALLPENGGMHPWEFDGFTSEDAWKRYREGDLDAYDENNDPSPTTADIVGAFEKALMVSGANRLGKLLELVQTGARLSLDQPTATSRDLPGANGASDSTLTGTPQAT
jgi:hypothetical protein